MNVSDLRGILQYVPRFRDRVFVIAVDGEVAASPNFANILLDLAVLRSLNVRIVLVHGASHQIQTLGQTRGVAISNADGTGITDDATLPVAIEASSRLTHDILQGLISADLRAAHATAIIAHPAGILGGQDYAHTGRVERVDARLLQLLLADGIIPVIPPLGFDGEGRTFRLNSDAVAVEVGIALGAHKILYLSAVGALKLTGTMVSTLSVTEADDLVKKRSLFFEPRLLSKLEQAIRACAANLPRVHILDGHDNQALLTEVFSSSGAGTMIYSNDYQQIRRVQKKDVSALLDLIRDSVASEELVKRTRTDILAQLDDYWVLEVDKKFVGCVAVHHYPEENKAELACLYVLRTHEGQGFGRRLMNYADQLAAERGATQIFALSTQTFNYFQQKGGYVEATPDDLPAERRRKWENSGRNSKVMQKTITRATPGDTPRS